MFLLISGLAGVYRVKNEYVYKPKRTQQRLTLKAMTIDMESLMGGEKAVLGDKKSPDSSPFGDL
jgi:hypothetical protein